MDALKRLCVGKRFSRRNSSGAFVSPSRSSIGVAVLIVAFHVFFFYFSLRKPVSARVLVGYFQRPRLRHCQLGQFKGQGSDGLQQSVDQAVTSRETADGITNIRSIVPMDRSIKSIGGT